MISTFHGIELAKRGLISSQGALNTTGQNLTNASNPDYSRQKVQLKTYHPIHPPGINKAVGGGQFGSGNTIENIKRIKDDFITNRIISQNANQGFWSEKTFYLNQIESINNQPNSPNLLERFETFIKDWNSLANNPSEASSREILKNSAIGLTSHINSSYKQLEKLRQTANESIKLKIKQLNTYTKEIAELNQEIRKIQANKNNPNDLLDKRDALVEKLSKLIDIDIEKSKNNEFIIYLNSQRLVQGEIQENLKYIENRENSGLLEIKWSNKEDLIIKNGEIGALLSIRDSELKNEINNLNTFSQTLIETVNDIHKDGIGLNLNTNINFFKTSKLNNTKDANIDKNADGILDSTSIYKVSGDIKLKLNDLIGTNGTIMLKSLDSENKDIKINYFSTDSVKEVIKKINSSKSNILSYINHNGNLTLKAASNGELSKNNYIIKEISDSGIFLSKYSGILEESGVEGTFSKNQTNSIIKLKSSSNYSISPHLNPASWISLNKAILNDINNIAAAKGLDTKGDKIINKLSGANDGSNALKIVAALTSENQLNSLSESKAIDHNPVMLDHSSKSFKSFINKNIANLASITQQANLELKKENAIVENLLTTKESISGVNIDEELTNMISYQHAYNSSARFITYVDRMLETIINRMGI